MDQLAASFLMLSPVVTRGEHKGQGTVTTVNKLYARTGRPSIAPEKLLRALLLRALYSVRSERLLMEQFDYNRQLEKNHQLRHRLQVRTLGKTHLYAEDAGGSIGVASAVSISLLDYLYQIYQQRAVQRFRRLTHEENPDIQTILSHGRHVLIDQHKFVDVFIP